MTVQYTGLPFLGEIAGNQRYVSGYTDQPTYARVLSNSSLDDLRKGISKSQDLYRGCCEGEAFQKIGHEYSCGGDWLPGGGYFRTIHVLEPNNKICFTYALSIFKDRLEQLTGKNLEQVTGNWVEGAKMKALIKSYFNPVETPQDGDMAVYSQNSNTPLHAGIYRATARNWRSPSGGTIESKWGQYSPYVFVHDVFFTPHTYGNVVQFYRVKDTLDT